MAYIKDVQVGSDVYLIEPALYIAPSKNGAAYTATLTNFSLVTGATVQAKFAATNDANATLNVNSTGAKEIHYNGAKITASQFKANHVYTLVYDGTQWQVVGDIDTNTTYSLSGLGGIGTISATGTAPLTLSGSKSGTTYTLTGSVADASASASGVVNTDAQTFSGVKTFDNGLHIYGTISTQGTGNAAGTMYPGGAYHSGHNSIILHGDTAGISGIGFTSEKATKSGTTTNINGSSDRAFIQYHAYGVTPAAEGTAPTLATSGELGTLVIGVGNDATDTIRLQAPGNAGILHQIGATAYPIPHTTNTNGSVGGTTTPVYVDAGVIKAGTALGTASQKAESYFAKASHNHTASDINSGTFDVARIPNSILKWQTTTAESTTLYDFGVYVNMNNANGSSMTGGNYFNILNIPYRKASGNTKADWGWQLGNTTANDGRLWYRTAGDNTWGDWQTIAHATQSTSDTGSSSQPVYMTKTGVITAITAVGAAYGGTGKTTLKDSANTLINALDTGSSPLTANDYVITQYVGGGTTTTTYHRRPANQVVNGTLVKAALGTVGTTAKKFLKDTGAWTQVAFSDLSGTATNAQLANSKVTIAGNDVSLGGSLTAATLTSSLGLSNALHFIGITSTALTDGSTTATLTAKTTNSLSKTTGFVDGDVVMDGDQLREYVWSGSAWRLLGITTSTTYKQPASTATNTWIAQVSQGTDGKITATTGSLNTSGTWSGNATTATTATNLANNPSIQTASNSNQVTITAGGKTSSAYTIPYATYAGSATSATTATYIKCTDTRNTALNPTDLTAAQGIRFDFKAKGTINLTATDAYAGVMSFRPYASNTDWSGGNAHQLAFNSEGLHWRNGGASWGNWYQILDSDNTAAGANATATLAWGDTYTLAKINGTDIKITAMAKPTASDVGAAPATHTHNYAGSSSAGGAATESIALLTASVSNTSADGQDARIKAAIKSYFDNNKANVPRGKTISLQVSTGNGVQATGYFISGYDSNPYGGFFVSHYDTPRYVGVSNGNYSCYELVRNNAGTYGINITGSAGGVAWTNVSGRPTNLNQFTNGPGYITGYTETDPTVPAWAKAATKPSYTASEVGAAPAVSGGYLPLSGGTMTGRLNANKGFTNLLTGTGTAGVNNNGTYTPVKWTFNTGMTAVDGDRFTVKIPNTSNADWGIFMSINNGTNYYPVVCNGSGRLTTHFPVNTYIDVVFESTGSAASVFPLAGGTARTTVSGGVWRVLNFYDTNNNDMGYYHRRIYPNLKAGGAIHPYSIIMQLPNGRWSSITTTAPNNPVSGTISPKDTGKAASTSGYMLGHVLLMSARATYADGNDIGTYNIWSAHSGLIDARYSFNLANSSGNGFTRYTPVYIVGTITNGLFYLDTTKWWTQTLPTSDDGKVYIYIGDAYDWYRLTFTEEKPIYWYKNGAVRLYNGASAASSSDISVGWNTSTTIATINGTAVKVKIPANPNTDTKNTAGSTNSDSKLYLIGATSQAANPQTYSDAHVFETNGAFSAKTLGVNADTDSNKVTLQYNTTDSSLEFVFA